MHLRRRTYRSKEDGQQQKTCSRFQVVFRDHLGRRQSIPAFTSVKPSEELGRKLDRLVAGKIAAEPLDSEMGAWLDGLPGAILARLGRIGLVDPVRMARTKSLEDHVLDWQASLTARGVSTKEVCQKIARARRIISGCGIQAFTDLTPDKISNYLASLRNDGAGLSRQTSNHFLRAIKQFSRWMVREQRAGQDPLVYVAGLNVRVDQRRVRRALTADECRRLVAATTNEPGRYAMAGPERALLYRVALETGLRAAELKSLTRGDFDIDAQHPSVTVRAAYSKNRRDDTLPLKAETAILLTAHLANKLPQAKAFSLTEYARTSRMLQLDLAAAGIPYRDPVGRVVDFHALRHTFITGLACAGVHPKTAQTLARHSDIRLTLDRYSHVLGEQQIDAVNRLPNLSIRPKAAGA